MNFSHIKFPILHEHVLERPEQLSGLDIIQYQTKRNTIKLGIEPKGDQITLSHTPTKTSFNTLVLWNRERTEYFHLGWGIRQGDPLSPYLFVLYLEHFSTKISMLVQLNHWKHSPLCKDGYVISHFLFVDDILLFNKATNHQALLMMDLVKEFCVESGQIISLDKYVVFFGHRVSQSARWCIQRSMGIRATDNLGKYSRVPICTERVSRQMYHFLIQNI